jgi:hypothetical protein
MSPGRNSRSLYFVHHKSSDRIEIRRAEEFSRYTITPSSPRPPYLHFTARDRLYICKCTDPGCHESSSEVASYSPHLAAELNLYLLRYHLELSTMADFHAYKAHQQTEWAFDGVNVSHFHYTTKQKDVVCRCKTPDHGYSPVRNPTIVELCVGFFRQYDNEMTCTKKQWRKDGSRPSTSDSHERDSFEYDSKSMHDLLNRPGREQQGFDVGPETPHPDMTHLRSGPNREPDIPALVWINARPSKWNDSTTTSSTPLGPAPVPQFPTVLPIVRPSSLRLGRRASVTTIWSAIQRDADGQAPEVSQGLVGVPQHVDLSDSLGISNSNKHGRRATVACKSKRGNSTHELPDPRGSEPFYTSLSELP